jgi:hypothetical protein
MPAYSWRETMPSTEEEDFAYGMRLLTQSLLQTDFWPERNIDVLKSIYLPVLTV